MKLEDIWIGDHVRLKDSRQIGKVTGIVNRKVEVRIDDDIVISAVDNLEIYEPPKEKWVFKDKENESGNRVLESRKFNLEIDLHIEKLQKSKANETPLAILEFQHRKLREYINKAISHHISSVTVIHGKGTGALKMDVYHILDSYDQVVSKVSSNQGGAVKVYFKY